MKYSLLILAILISFGLVGCSDLSTPVSTELPADSEMDAVVALITYDISLIGADFDPESGTTFFSYAVTSNPNGGAEISYWNIELPEGISETDVISASEQWSWVNPDPTTAITGIQFDSLYSYQEQRIVSFTLDGQWTVGRVLSAVKAGKGYVLDLINGPASRMAVQATYTVDGFVYYDINSSGSLDAGEPGLADFTVSLSNGATVTTNSNGYYIFDNVLPGEYTVAVDAAEGFINVSDAEVGIEITDMGTNASFGLTVEFNDILPVSAECHAIGFWKNNIRKAIQGRTRGVQISAATLEGYIGTLSGFALAPLNFTSLGDAYSTLTTNGGDAVNLLSKHLTASEFNYLNGAYLGGNQQLTWAFIYYGEYVIANASQFSRQEIIATKNMFAAFNDSGD